MYTNLHWALGKPVGWVGALCAPVRGVRFPYLANPFFFFWPRAVDPQARPPHGFSPPPPRCKADMECQLTITSAWIFLQLSGMHIGGQVCVCDFFFFSFFGNAPGLSSPPTPSASLPTLLPLAPGKPAGPSRSGNVYICGRRSSWCRGVQVGVGAGCHDLLSSFGGVCQCRQLVPSGHLSYCSQDPVVQAAAAPAVRMQRSVLRKHAFTLCVGAPCGVVPLSGCSLAGNSTMNEHMHSNNYLA